MPKYGITRKYPFIFHLFETPFRNYVSYFKLLWIACSSFKKRRCENKMSSYFIFLRECKLNCVTTNVG